MPVLSGEHAAVAGVAATRQWRLRYDATPRAYRSSATDRATARLAGPLDWRADVQTYSLDPPAMPGEVLDLQAHTGDDQVSGQALVEAVTVSCDIESGEPPTLDLELLGDGPLTRGPAAPTADPLHLAISPLAAGVLLDGIEQPDVRRWSLRIFNQPHAYVTSATAGQTRRVPAALDAVVRFTQYQARAADLPQPGAVHEVSLRLDAARHWDLRWMRVADLQPLAPVESGRPVAAEVELRFQAAHLVDDLPALGAITPPLAAQPWWPSPEAT